jgi:hypothetical protein
MDILASLWPVEIDVTVGRAVYTIPSLPAADWVAVVATNDAFAIVPGLLADEDQLRVWDALEDGLIELPELTTLARHALEAAAGRPWWEAQHLVVGATQSWDVLGGKLLLSGVDLGRISLGAFCNTIYALATDGMEKKDRMKFDMELHRPPVEALEEVAQDSDYLASQFRAAFVEAQRGA